MREGRSSRVITNYEGTLQTENCAFSLMVEGMGGEIGSSLIWGSLLFVNTLQKRCVKLPSTVSQLG